MRHGQAAMEHVAVIAIVSLIVIPTVFMFLTYSQQSQEQLKEGQVTKIGRDIISQAELVYYAGPPSRAPISATMPDNVLNITIRNDTLNQVFELVFTLGTPGDHHDSSFPSKVEIRGVFGDIARSPGLKKVLIESMKDVRPYVLINIT